MNKTILLLAAGMLLAGCVNTSKVTVNASQLEHHRFVLESVNGKTIPAGKNPPELSFGEKMHLSGSMCNRFTGQGKLSEGELKAKDLAMTRMMCADAQRNELDNILSTMLSKGAQVDLTGDQLTLATAEQTLVYRLSDLMN
ncbi:heat shock protein HslJ [Trabulsiella odontotermitis]|uniref:heat shock protein HslJ n=1 Tax=Trabulsiella odontotermitis TaxID=379893 RepID=UPI0024B87133|nr:heat shock protein HslJ [Trabulsiella odontotermitis]WHP33330.1 heat shock protein HslJ [Trabulsiella odontotermitis]